MSATQHKIRLQGIDAPEKGQAFGNASGKSLTDLVAILAEPYNNH